MDKEIQGQQVSSAIRKLYPTLTETELGEAEKNLRRYFEIAAEIQHRQALDAASVDTSLDAATMRERSNSLKI